MRSIVANSIAACADACAAASDCFAFDYKPSRCYLNVACASQDVGDGPSDFCRAFFLLERRHFTATAPTLMLAYCSAMCRQGT